MTSYDRGHDQGGATRYNLMTRRVNGKDVYNVWDSQNHRKAAGTGDYQTRDGAVAKINQLNGR